MMSKAFKCDRCKNYVEGEPHKVMFHIADGDKRFEKIKHETLSPGIFLDGYCAQADLCNACTGAYDNMLETFLKFLPPAS